MAFLGRESHAHQQRAQQCKNWVQARSPYAPVSMMLGLMAVLDFFTLVLGLALGAAAIASGILGIRHIRRQPELLGRRLCGLGLVLGAAGVVLSLFMWLFVY